LLLDSRPVASGVLIGVLACKPHFGLLLPLFLAVTGRWRVFCSAAATVVVLAGATALLFGADIFTAFVRALPAAADGYVQRHGLKQVVAWGDLESVYGLLRAIGLPAVAAWCGHAAAGLVGVIVVLRLAATDARFELQMAALATTMLLLTPYSELNDVAILMVPWAFLVADGRAAGFCRSEQAVLALVFLLPLMYLPGRALVKLFGWPGLAQWAGMGPLICTLLIAVIVERSWRAAPAGSIVR
jgi:alpha-1,2-mannosyltransferase